MSEMHPRTLEFPPFVLSASHASAGAALGDSAPGDKELSRSSGPAPGPRGFIAKLGASTPNAQELGLALIRVGFGLSLALAHGLGKLENPGGFIAGLTQGGFPAPALLGWVAIVSEFFGGLLLALGLLTRPAAAAVLGTLGVAALYVHAADPWQRKELAFAYVLVSLAVLIAGPGRYSVDQRLGARVRAAG